MENTLKTMLTVWHVVAVQCRPSVMTGAKLKSSAILSYFEGNQMADRNTAKIPT